ncbi:MAG TPA: tetratricopeptide repeat protein, partial [Gammaproteobacteria bacterium]|nr:tetratricopeptide repeat protein [Gammaproteobacteria bacterium]
ACSTEPVLTAAVPGDPPEVIQARRTLNEKLNLTPLVKDVVFEVNPGDARDIAYTDPRDGGKYYVSLFTLIPSSISVDFSPGSVNVESAWKVSYTDYVKMTPYFWLSSSWSQTDAQAVAEALRILSLDARQDLVKTNDADFQKFTQTCAAPIAQKTWPPMPEEAREHEVLAENATRESDFDKALDEYTAALQAYPCWPEGWRQRALIQGQEHYYLGAYNSLRHYLDLVPDAPDTNGLRDQLIIWRDKAGI